MIQATLTIRVSSDGGYSQVQAYLQEGGTVFAQASGHSLANCVKHVCDEIVNTYGALPYDGFRS